MAMIKNKLKIKRATFCKQIVVENSLLFIRGERMRKLESTSAIIPAFDKNVVLK